MRAEQGRHTVTFPSPFLAPSWANEGLRIGGADRFGNPICEGDSGRVFSAGILYFTSRSFGLDR